MLDSSLYRAFTERRAGVEFPCIKCSNLIGHRHLADVVYRFEQHPTVLVKIIICDRNGLSPPCIDFGRSREL